MTTTPKPRKRTVKPESVEAVKQTAIKVHAMLLARLRGEAANKETAKPKEFAPYDPPPGVIPNNLRAQTIAMDSTDYGYLNSAYLQGAAPIAAFPGYPYLAMLSQLPEYRKMSSTIADQMTRKFITVVSKGGEDKDDAISRMTEALQKYKVQELFREASLLDSFFGRGQIYVDVNKPGTNIPASVDPAELMTPLIRDPAKISKGSLRGFRVVEPVWTYPSAYNATNPLAPDYYKPSQWFVMGLTVHTSRLLMFCSRPMPDILKAAYNFGGISITQLAEPYVNNWTGTRDSVRDIVRSFSITGIATNLQALLSEGDTAETGTSMLDRAELFNLTRDNRGLMMLDKTTEEMFQFNTPLSGLDALQNQALEQLCVVPNIPLVYMTGITPSGLNASSEGEIAVFHQFILSMQEAVFTPNLDAIFQIIQLSEFGKVDPDLGYVYEPLDQMDPVEMATIRKSNAETDATLIGAGVISPDDSRARIAADPDAGYNGLELNPPDDLEDGDPDPDPNAEPDKKAK